MSGAARASTAPLATRSWKVVPPELPAWFVERPRLLDTLSVARSVRLTTVVAGAGFGKSSLLASWAGDLVPAWYTLEGDDNHLGTLARGLTDALKLRVPDLPPFLRAAGEPGPSAEEASRAEAFAGFLSEFLHERLSRDLVLVLDDAQEIQPGSPAARLIQSLCRQAPPLLHVVVASRADLPFSLQRLRGRGQVLDLAAWDLRFTPAEVSDVLRSHGLDPTLAAPLHRVTAGWPVAVGLAAGSIRSLPAAARPRALEALARPGGPISAYLAEEVLEAEAPEVVDLLRVVADLEACTPDLCRFLGHADAAEHLARLAGRGLVVERAGEGEAWHRPIPLLGEFIRERYPLPEAGRRHLHGRAAVWYEEGGFLEKALRSLEQAGEPAEVAAFLTRHGDTLIDSGLVRIVIDGADLVPGELRTPEIELLLGQAWATQGEWEEALVSFRRAAGDARELPPGLAWRMGLIHYFRGESDLAMHAYARGRIDRATTAGEAMLLAWTAALRWMGGDGERCREDAELASRAATASGDLRALAAAHTTHALLACLNADRRANDAHYLTALDAAERGGDLFQMVRIRINRSSHLYEEGRYGPAREELDIAIRLGELAGFAPHLALAYSNRGWTWFYQGELERAVADFERSRTLYQRLDSRRIAYPLTGLGEVYRERGDLALARASFEEAVRQSEEAEDLQGLVPALAGLARVVAQDDPVEAAALADRAVALGTGHGCVAALLSQGWVALAVGRNGAAMEAGSKAAAAARERRDRAGLAEALELQALASESPELRLLDDAAAVWREIGNPLGEARAELAAARLRRLRSDRARSEVAERRLVGLGVRPHAATAAGPLRFLSLSGSAGSSVRALGGFLLVRDGRPIPNAEWPSKKARDLLKLLVARRGHPVHREVLMGELWPEEDPDTLTNRLSVALTGLRTALDPNRRFPPDYYVLADHESVGLDLARLDVDVEQFLARAEGGLALLRCGQRDEAGPLLEAAEAAYTGDFFEEARYAEWAVALREEARAAYVSVVRALADLWREQGEYDAATKYYLRLLERDPYDEAAHLALVTSATDGGRHGEARRLYGAYLARMAEIDVEPSPFPVPDRRDDGDGAPQGRGPIPAALTASNPAARARSLHRHRGPMSPLAGHARDPAGARNAAN